MHTPTESELSCKQQQVCQKRRFAGMGVVQDDEEEEEEFTHLEGGASTCQKSLAFFEGNAV